MMSDMKIKAEPTEFQGVLPGGVCLTIVGSDGVDGEGIHLGEGQAIALALAVYACTNSPGSRLAARILKVVAR